MARSLCCFFDPGYSDEPRTESDVCPQCGRPYGFPLTEAPLTIGDFNVVRALSRGFYSAAYHVTGGALEVPYVLKVSPVSLYEAFAGYKDFESECRLHRSVAEGSDHLVPIHDMFEADVSFGGEEMRCHVAQLDFVDGDSLEVLLAASPPPPARTVAQIALDLLQLLAELRAKEARHNDLHDGNIIVQRLGATSRRAEALDDSIRVVAIDLGSASEESRSGATRLGDLRSIAAHLDAFAERLLLHPSGTSDLDYRLAAQLQEVAALLASEAVNQRPPEFSVLRDRIRQAHDFVSSPWKEPPRLRSFDDSYNAQTLHPWFVPRLLVDPGGLWHEEISVRGPQVITGMRGCGKTMLLRSLMFHARAATHQMSGDDASTTDRLEKDGYVGLYVSCNRLLDPLGSSHALHAPEARLFVAYVRESLRALRHLREIDRSLVTSGAALRIGSALRDYVAGLDGEPETDDELVLERQTLRVLASLQRQDDTHRLLTDPTAAFVGLADAVRAASTLWTTSSIFFLLDDVSTRHLDEDSIKGLMSRLIFSSDTCAFKMTTEEQTLEYVLKSPGLIEKARPGRDYKVFDLGARVTERIRLPLRDGGGTNFIRDILAMRAAQYQAHPSNVSPAQFLGDKMLKVIAEELARLSPTASERKRVYHGLRALTAVCVGDIGDVLAIYETMFRRAGSEQVPFPPEVQHRCFQEYCSQRLYHVNHRDGRFKDFALGFAGAARDLLVQSRSEDRLRQYSTVYVRVTTDDTEDQFEQLRMLIDAGIFVLDGGAPRTKTRDSDPVQQFVLKFRKLFGLTSSIGLADRDRFELSGDDLRLWLADPTQSKAILMRNLVSDDADDHEEAPLEEFPHDDSASAAPMTTTARQHTLLELLDDEGETESVDAQRRVRELSAARCPVVTELQPVEVITATINSALLGLGFEDRTLESARRFLDVVQPERAMLIRYDEVGHSEAIERLVRHAGCDIEVVHYRDAGPAADQLPPAGVTLIDVTGLAKPLIFQSVRRALVREGTVYVVHTQADVHYPLDEAIEPVLAAERDDDFAALLAGLEGVWPGEEGPYSFERLLLTDADESRRRYLIASASPKHQRLLSLVQDRQLDRVEVFTPFGDTPRDQLARRAAKYRSGLG